MGRMLPTDVEEMTINQVLILTIPAKYLTTYVTATPEELEAAGHIPPQPAKSKCQMMQEAAAERRAKEQDAKQSRRDARRKARRAAKP